MSENSTIKKWIFCKNIKITLGLLLCITTASYAQFDRLDVYVAPAVSGTGTVFDQDGTIIPQGQNVTVTANVHRTGDGVCSGANQIGATLIVRSADTLTDPSWSGPSPACEANRWLQPVSTYTGGDLNPYADASTMTPQNTGTNQAADLPQGITMVQIACGTVSGTNATYTYEMTLVDLPAGRYSIEVRVDNYNATPSYQNSWTYSTCSGFGSGSLQYITVGKQGIFRELLGADTQVGSTQDQLFYLNSFQPGDPSVSSWNITGSATGADAGDLCQNDSFLLGFEEQTFKNTTLSANVTGVQLQFSVTSISGGLGFATKTANIPYRTDCPSGSNPGSEPGGGSCINTTVNGYTDVDQMWQMSHFNTDAGNTTSTIQNGDPSIDVSDSELNIAQMIKDVNGGLFPAGNYQLNVTTVATFGDATTQSSATITKPFTISNQTGCAPLVLPITLTNFQLSGAVGNVLLEWKVASESTTSYFDVERSTDGKVFVPIDRVVAEGNSSTPISYSYTDNTLSNGEIFYRLKIVDQDGSFTYSPIRSISNSNLQNGFTISPNPGSGNFVIGSNNTTENIHLTVLTALGQKVITTNGNLSTINAIFNSAISNQADGIYFVQLYNNEKQACIKLIKK